MRGVCRPQPMVGAAVPCRPPRQPTPPTNGRGGSPLPPARPQPNGRGGSPLPPAASQPMVGAAVPCRPPRQPDREAVSLKTCSLVFVSETCGAFRRNVSEPFVAPRSLFSTISTFSTAIPVRAAGDCRPYRWTTHGQTRAGGRGLPPLPLERAHAPPLSLHFLHFLHG